VRDLVVRERLEALARVAAERFRELVRRGEEVPFEVTGPADDSPFAQYAPLTARFVRENAVVLADLDPFAEACAAIGEASLAGPYLEQLGEPVPDWEQRRSEAAAIAFLARLWEGSSDFALEGDRLPSALRELEGCVETPDGEAEVVAPLIGFHMPTTRLALATATLVRADVVEVPDEVRRTEGTRRSAWEPQFLAVVRGAVPVRGDPEPPPGGPERAPPGVALRELVTTLRLFKAGGVGLGPYAWARTPRDRWRRIATGAPRPPAGGYRLTDSELGDLAALSRALENRSAPFGDPSHDRPSGGGTLARAISRFEAGLERPALLEALSDYVLALRHLLDGGGAADVGLAMRVAALCAGPDERPPVKAQVERALALERSLMRGEPPHAGEGAAPLELVAQIEDRARSLLRDVACGRLSVDLRAAADEALLADGLAAGEGARQLRGATAEWGAIDPEAATKEPASGREEGDMQEIASEQPTRVLMAAQNNNASNVPDGVRDATPKEDSSRSDWLSEVDSEGDTLDFPERPEALKLLDRRPVERERARRRLRHLFPRPETTEWSVAELEYDRRPRRARV
jgi:hypothetical protein